MSVLRYLRFRVFCGALAVLVTTSVSLADRDGRGGRGGADHSSSGSLNGGGGGGSSLRSFSGGGNKSIRSFSGGDSGGSSRSLRSFSGGDLGGSSVRSSSGVNNRPTSRSFSTDGGYRPSTRSLNFDSGSLSSRSTGNGGASARSLLGSNPSFGAGAPTGEGSAHAFSRSRDSASGNAGPNTVGQPTMKRFPGGPTQNSFSEQGVGAKHSGDSLQSIFQSGTGDGNSRARSTTGGTEGRPTFYGQQLGSVSGANGNGTKDHQARRATGDEVRNFLNLRGNEARGNDATRLSDSAKKGSGNSNHNNGASNSGGNDPLVGNGQNVFRGRDGNKRVAGDDPAGIAGNNTAGDKKRLKLEDAPNGRLDGVGTIGRNQPGARDGDGSNKLVKHLGLDDGNGPGVRRGGDELKGDIKHLKDLRDGKDFDRAGRGREFRGGDIARGEFDKWNNTWKGKKGEGHDHRDWSGKWRDGHRFDIAHDIRHDWHRRYDHHDHDRIPFCGGWWGSNHFHHHGWGFWNDYCVRWHRPWFWWSWTSAPVLYDWCGFGWSTPYYWDYGPGEYIYCNNGIVYVNGVWYEPAPVFYQQTVRLVEQAPVLAPEAAAQVEWLPLGVFAVTPDGLKEPSVMVQLAVTKDGVIAGTAFDEAAGKSYNIQGTVDKNTQRAVWSYTDDKNNRIVMETSVNNLTQNESTGLVHYGPNDMRVVEFVRLQEPDAKPAAQPGGALVPPQGK